jgi:hypothetical protein
VADAIGKVLEQTGPTEIQRNKVSIPSDKDTGVEMNDAVVTANARVGIVFKDDSRVQITEQSKLVIDSFVYDDTKADAGKLGLKVAMGTARFASGQIAKHSPESIKIETPTATVGVRGTDFTMTVDELGRSMIILLPSCPTNYKNIERDCTVGEVTVDSDAGRVILNKPFQATLVKARENNPLRPVILKVNQTDIDNLLILTPPKELKRAEVSDAKNVLDFNALDKDLLKFDGLTTDFFAETNGKLSMNYLDQQFLYNMLDLLNSQLLANELNALNGMLPHYPPNKAAGLLYVLDYNNLTLYRTTLNSFASVNVDKDSGTVVSLNQDGVTLKQVVNRTGGTVINIVQSK